MPTLQDGENVMTVVVSNADAPVDLLHRQGNEARHLQGACRA